MDRFFLEVDLAWIGDADSIQVRSGSSYVMARYRIDVRHGRRVMIPGCLVGLQGVINQRHGAPFDSGELIRSISFFFDPNSGHRIGRLS